MLKDFFMCRDIDKWVKWIYAGGPVNMLLWGAESWSITKKILKKLQSFHHSSIRRILGIRIDEVQESHITNKQVRHWFDNIPPIEDFITRRTWRYIGKAYTKQAKTPSKKSS